MELVLYQLLLQVEPVIISRNGDLVHKVYVVSESTGIRNGSELVSDVELEIGGQRIDRQYSEWMKVWKELSTPESKALGLKSMQGDHGLQELLEQDLFKFL